MYSVEALISDKLAKTVSIKIGNFGRFGIRLSFSANSKIRRSHLLTLQNLSGALRCGFARFGTCRKTLNESLGRKLLTYWKSWFFIESCSSYSCDFRSRFCTLENTRHLIYCALSVLMISEDPNSTRKLKHRHK